MDVWNECARISKENGSEDLGQMGHVKVTMRKTKEAQEDALSIIY
jgi:hypothetical protein